MRPWDVLVVDAANVIGSRPTGWWRDRPGAARQFVEQLRDAARQARLPLPAVVILEGAARAGMAESDVEGVRVIHAAHDGDSALVAETAAATTGVIVVTADFGRRATSWNWAVAPVFPPGLPSSTPATTWSASTSQAASLS
jgi:hypothetical protein